MTLGGGFWRTGIERGFVERDGRGECDVLEGDVFEFEVIRLSARSLATTFIWRFEASCCRRARDTRSSRSGGVLELCIR